MMVPMMMLTLLMVTSLVVGRWSLLLLLFVEMKGTR